MTMEIDEAIEMYTSNAEYERTHGSLQGCLEFKQLAEWLRDYKRLKEQEPCDVPDINDGDIISRQAVLDTLSELNAISFYEAQEDSKEAYYEIRQAIKNLQPVKPQEPKWIPVSERLPENIKPVIVTWKNTDPKSYYQYIVGKHFIGTAHYKGGKWFWYSSVTEDLLAEYGKCDSEEFDEAIEVIAWMPLPQPYKAESEPQERSEE